MEFKEVVKNRYSCKKYSARKLEAAKLEQRNLRQFWKPEDLLPLPRTCRSSTCTSFSRKRFWPRSTA